MGVLRLRLVRFNDDVGKGGAGIRAAEYIMNDSDQKRSPSEIHTSLIRTLHAGFCLVLIHGLFLHYPLLPRIYVRHLYLLDKNALRILG